MHSEAACRGKRLQLLPRRAGPGGARLVPVHGQGAMTSVKNTQNALLAEAKILEMERAEAERERQDIERLAAERRAAQEQATIERGRALAEQVQREVAARQAQEEAAARAWAAQEEQGRLAHAALDAEKRALWNDAVKQRAAEKLEVLSTMAVISGLKRRIEIVDSSLVSAQTLAAQKLAADTLARLQAAERAAAGAAATEAALRRELEDSLKIKTELFDTCKKLAKQLQDAQRGLSDGEKEQAQAKLKDSQIKVLQTENESLEAQLRQAWKECQDQADLNTALAAELKVQAIASASQESRAKDTDVGADASAGPLANTATEDTDEGARRKRDTGDDGSKVTALEKRVRELMGSVHELEMTVDIKDDDLRQAHVLLGERDKELKELKPLLHQLQEVNKQLEERAAKDEVSARPSSDAVEQYASPDYIKKLRHETNSSAAVMKQFRAALEQAESRAHEMEEQTRTSKESVEVASHAAQEKIKALEAQCMYYQQQLEHERAGRPASGAHNAPLQGGCTKCAQYEQHLALLQAASRRAESAAESAVARYTHLPNPSVHASMAVHCAALSGRPPAVLPCVCFHFCCVQTDERRKLRRLRARPGTRSCRRGTQRLREDWLRRGGGG